MCCLTKSFRWRHSTRLMRSNSSSFHTTSSICTCNKQRRSSTGDIRTTQISSNSATWKPSNSRVSITSLTSIKTLTSLTGSSIHSLTRKVEALTSGRIARSWRTQSSLPITNFSKRTCQRTTTSSASSRQTHVMKPQALTGITLCIGVQTIWMTTHACGRSKSWSRIKLSTHRSNLTLKPREPNKEQERETCQSDDSSESK